MNLIACVKRENTMLEYGLHMHNDCYEIITNHIGGCIATVGNERFEMKKNDILIIPPKTSHIAYSENEFADFFVSAKHLHYDKVHMVNDSDNVVLPLMEMIYIAMLEKDVNYKRIADTLLDSICCYLDKYINTHSRHSFVSDLKNTIIENFTDPEFRLNEAIEKTSYNVDYMRRCFYSDTGKTPLQYLTELRINRAKMLLLQNHNNRVNIISEQCGFKDSFYFSYLFKKYTGCSPVEYRKSHENEQAVIK